MPDNGCLADYVTSDEMVESFEAVAQAGKAARRGSEPAVLSLGFHQETASKFLPRLREALLEIETRAAAQRIPVRYERTRDVALAVAR